MGQSGIVVSRALALFSCALLGGALVLPWLTVEVRSSSGSPTYVGRAEFYPLHRGELVSSSWLSPGGETPPVSSLGTIPRFSVSIAVVSALLAVVSALLVDPRIGAVGGTSSLIGGISVLMWASSARDLAREMAEALRGPGSYILEALLGVGSEYFVEIDSPGGKMEVAGALFLLSAVVVMVLQHGEESRAEARPALPGAGAPAPARATAAMISLARLHLEGARALLREGLYSPCVVCAHKAAELALKAAACQATGSVPVGSSIERLAPLSRLPDLPHPVLLRDLDSSLTKASSPDVAAGCSMEEAERAVRAAEKIVSTAEELIGARRFGRG